MKLHRILSMTTKTHRAVEKLRKVLYYIKFINLWLRSTLRMNINLVIRIIIFFDRWACFFSQFTFILHRIITNNNRVTMMCSLSQHYSILRHPRFRPLWGKLLLCIIQDCSCYPHYFFGLYILSKPYHFCSS